MGIATDSDKIKAQRNRNILRKAVNGTCSCCSETVNKGKQCSWRLRWRWNDGVGGTLTTLFFAQTAPKDGLSQSEVLGQPAHITSVVVDQAHSFPSRASRSECNLHDKFPLPPIPLDSNTDDVMGSVVCVGSEWHRFPSSFFIPDHVGQVQWIDDGFRGLLPLPFNSTLGGTSAAPPYFNDKNKASDEQYLLDLEKCTFLIELQLQRPYPSRGSDLSTWETVAALPYLDRELSPPMYRSFFIPYLWQQKNVFGIYKLLKRIPK
ncbi:alg9-like mannosyltransferase family [Actinidia rufa]|uniref:Alg9-like mannosyltransferase family n=1 Tax=Actinidia rufa TaxID=165716 RepID=A0A7J0G2V8_9ERIC|nr:alg9-like mannosyltransferase family [Actinidia rufa]